MSVTLLPLSPISTHALREEGDRRPSATTRGLTHFYPRPPRGGRLLLCVILSRHGRISTHALREEGDHVAWVGGMHHQHFYPRPPRGGRQDCFSSFRAFVLFLPTPSARRATSKIHKQGLEAIISTHALREEGDLGILPGLDLPAISTHALREEGDQALSMDEVERIIFLPTPSARRATDSSNAT